MSTITVSNTVLPTFGTSDAGIAVLGNDDTITVDGQSNAVAVNGTLDTLILDGNGNAVTANGAGGTISSIGQNDTIAANGTLDQVTLDGTSLSLSIGNDGNISLVAGTHVTIGGNDATISELAGSNNGTVFGGTYLTFGGDGGMLDVAAPGADTTFDGDDAIVILEASAPANTLTVNGQDARLNIAAGGSTITADGNGASIDVTGSNNAIDVTGSAGNSVTLANYNNILDADGASITFATSSGALIDGNNDTISVAGNDVMTLTGSSATITGYGFGDTIVLQGVTGALDFDTLSEVLTVGGRQLQLSGITPADTFVAATILDAGIASTEITAECFLAGSRIATPQGAVRVENLRIGDEVVISGGGVERIEWIGRRAYDARFADGNHLVLPVCVRANAIADRVPARDLYVSPGHGIFIDGVLVPAWRLVNGKSVTQPELPTAAIAYFHIELGVHAVLLAEDCPVESYLDIGNRSQFQNAASDIGRMAERVPLPRVEGGIMLAAIKAKLDCRAGIAYRGEDAANPLIGCVEAPQDGVLSGWAFCPDDPETPIRLEIYFWLGGTLGRKTVLANGYRAELRRAPLRSGCHGFALALPANATGIRVQRSIDGALLTSLDMLLAA